MAVSGAWNQAPLVLVIGAMGSLYLIFAFLGYRNSMAKSNNIVRTDMLAYLASWQALEDKASLCHASQSICVSLVSDIQSSIDARQCEWLGGGRQGRKVCHVMIFPSITNNTKGQEEEDSLGSQKEDNPYPFQGSYALVESLDFAYYQVI